MLFISEVQWQVYPIKSLGFTFCDETKSNQHSFRVPSIPIDAECHESQRNEKKHFSQNRLLQ